MAVVRPRSPGDLPQTVGQGGDHGKLDLVGGAVFTKPDRAGKAAAVTADTFVANHGILPDMRARPVPNSKPFFQRLAAEIGVEIGFA